MISRISEKVEVRKDLGSGTLTPADGTYVARTAIGDRRIVSMTQNEVTFRWKDRARGGRQRLETIRGEEFCVRYLRHVLPRGMRATSAFVIRRPR